MSGFFAAVHEMVRQIPPGRVATYGTIAALLGRPRDARAVGYALRALKEGTDVPWHRVINAQGTVSLKGRDPGDTDLQRMLLEREGIAFDVAGRLDLRRWGWSGETP